MSKIERIKAATDGLDVLPELLRAAREGWETLDPDHVGLLKWYGLYAHNTADGHFMMRVKVIQGKLSLAQAETMAWIAEQFGRGLINDIALSGAIAEDGTRGFNLRVGGGLSTQPRFARWMDVFLTPEECPEVIEAMTGIFRDAEENRKARGKARLKFLVDRVGPEALREELETRVGRPLRRGVQKAPGLSGEDHIGVLPQADDRYRTVGMVVPVGRLRASQLQGLADLARKHGANEDDALRLTHQQNVLLPWIPAENVDALLAEPLVQDLTPTPTL